MQQASQPVIGISSCLLGEQVRYDGGHKKQNTIIEFINGHNRLISFCPEVSAQLGVLRPPIELIVSDKIIYALGRDNAELNVTHALENTASVIINTLKQEQAVAYIFKARSPSCGVNSTPLLNSKKEVIGLTSGLVADKVLAHCPSLIVIDESTVNTADKCQRFNMACQLATSYQQTDSHSLSPWISQTRQIFPSLENKKICSVQDKQKYWNYILNTYLYPWLKQE